MKCVLKWKISLLFCLSFIYPWEAWALSYLGRVMTGGYLSSERFSNPIAGSISNDSNNYSGRLYFKAYNIGSRDLETVIDLRDREDLYENLNQQALTLDPGNIFQAYQLDVRLN